ncbi:LPS export ABC transporter permease LptG [Thermomonas hydrothermalis]|uniref:Lipopolysaccharide export system permease protein n=1 Tax=Thermomonas hydrothermalis TaxID=213588 RepID=A0A1M4VNM2_9GAMM|nr:LPS export ABC transporter permease LptG [Thermomonas hydrothermalis]SHE70447.1 lipopolysaccharide export system permease protein [Thermomonas hydrothermalis]
MKRWPRLHDLYLARSVLASILLAWAVLLGLDVVLAFAGDMDEIGRGGYTLGHAIAATGLTIPGRIYQLFPTAAVIGTLLALGQLAASAELTILSAVGVSRARLAGAVLALLGLITVLMLLVGDTLAPWGNARAREIKSLRYGDMALSRYSGLWAREGNMFLNARDGQERRQGDARWLELRGVRLFEFDGDGRLRSIAHVARAEHRDGAWLLHNVERDVFAAKSVQRSRVAQERWASQLDATVLSASIARPGTLRSAELRNAIEYRRRNQLDASEFENEYWSRWFYPFNVLALVLAALPFAFGSLRSGGYGKRLFIGIVFALGFWVLQMISSRLAGIYHIDFRIAYALPPIIMLTVSFLMFQRRS